MTRALVTAITMLLTTQLQIQAQMPAEPEPRRQTQEPGEMEQSHMPPLHFGGFGDVLYSGPRASGAKDFSLGQFVLHFNSSLDPRIFFFSELSFTPRSDAGMGSPAAPGFNPEIERLILRLDQSDALKF